MVIKCLQYSIFVGSWLLNVCVAMIYIEPIPVFLILVHPLVVVGVFLSRREDS